ncbi:MAG: hypothetical protein MJ229_08330 [bacterium]|nr:hypothetical protein [bacterium]
MEMSDGMITPMFQDRAVNSDQQILNRIENSTSSKEKLKKVAQEFESVFITKILTLYDKTVDREGGIFGDEASYYDKMKSFVFDEVGRQLASNPRTSFGFAKQIYDQMEKYVQ